MPTRQHTVPPEARGARLDAFLVSVEPELSRSRLQALIGEGAILLDGAPTKPSKLLKGGESVELTIAPPKPAIPQPEAIPLNVLYEDHDLIVVDKPAGMVVHPAAGNEAGTLVNALLAHCHDLAGIGGELRPGIVHRLDKDTTGCLVAAKNGPALAGLQAQFKARRVSKIYQALVHGVPAASGRIETLYGRHPTDRKRFTGKVDSGRTAITEWKLLQSFPGAAHVEVNLLTGRTHQVRVHFAEAGHPLLSDALYGGRKREKKLPPESLARRAAEAIGRHALHAGRLAFVHPRTGAPIDLEAPLPADFRRALEILGR